ncbi:MAG: hypothetical protein EAZ44_04385 [Cytophagia bacterium]|nr:MAG: hypothetical protein EAZ44_04385 [Cytophagia bacterium]TAG43567.1 MAG: hypothetical protein EAZ31_03880 [Cytophagia bacterium]
MRNATKIFFFCLFILIIVYAMKQVENNTEGIEQQAIPIIPIQKNNPAGTMPPAWYPPFYTSTVSNIKLTDKENLAFVYTGSQTNTLDKFQVINVSDKKINLRTQDGSLLMVQEAKNTQGEWQAIEYWQWDWGMKEPIFETISLLPQKNLNFVAPKYSGSFKTKMRFKLKSTETNDNQEFYYSDTFEMSVNPSQFNLNTQKVKGNAEIWK